MSKKSSNLAELARYGIKVPKGFHLDDSHYREAIEPVRPAIISAVLKGKDVSDIFEQLHVPERTIAVLQQELTKFPSSTVFAVRSSGNVVAHGHHIAEDGHEVSLAGQFESFLNVPRDQVHFAVAQCWASLFNERSRKVFDMNTSYVEESSMTVLVQEMMVAAASAVVMTVDPLGDGRLGGIEIAVGPCEAIVSGAVSPDEVFFYRDNGTIAERRIGAKEFVIEYAKFSRGGHNLRRVPLSADLRKRMAVNDSVMFNIIDIARSVERIFGRPQDIEVVIDDVEQITVVQSRSITRLPSQFVSFGDY